MYVHVLVVHISTVVFNGVYYPMRIGYFPYQLIHALEIYTSNSHAEIRPGVPCGRAKIFENQRIVNDEKAKCEKTGEAAASSVSCYLRPWS